jgi:hypothetical protein
LGIDTTLVILSSLLLLLLVGNDDNDDEIDFLGVAVLVASSTDRKSFSETVYVVSAAATKRKRFESSRERVRELQASQSTEHTHTIRVCGAVPWSLHSI